MKTLLRPIIFSLLTILISFSLNACHTVEGVGKDMQQGGKSLQKAANKNK